MKWFLMILFSIVSIGHADTCEQKMHRLQNQIYQFHGFNNYRRINQKINSEISTEESETYNSLAKKFNQLLSDNPGNYDDLYALQNEAKKMTRAIATRTGYQILNAETGNPFDAVIAEIKSADGIVINTVEVRGLLIQKSPLPHTAVWIHGFNPKVNPWKIINIDLFETSDNDFVSWSTDNGRRSGNLKELLKYLLNGECG